MLSTSLKFDSFLISCIFKIDCRVGQMSINQAAIHYNLPYSSLYGRFKRGKYEADHPSGDESMDAPVSPNIQPQIMVLPYSVSVSSQFSQVLVQR